MSDVKERPILFSAPMVRALLDRRKTQTRRVVKPYPRWAERFPICDPSGMAAGHEVWWWNGEHDRVGVAQSCPYGAPGGRLWVREAFMPRPRLGQIARPHYRADEDRPEWRRLWKPSIHMPRWASRITLQITDIRVERLNDISEADALAEGIVEYEPTEEDPAEFAWDDERGRGELWNNARSAYRDLWERINGRRSWAANPWVWVVEFERVDA